MQYRVLLSQVSVSFFCIYFVFIALVLKSNFREITEE